MHHHIHRADRFLYLPLVGLALAIGLCLRPLGPHAQRKVLGFSGAVLAITVLLVLNATSVRQVRTWKNAITTWENCVRVAPDNFLARRILADRLVKAGEYDRAYEHFKAALKINAYNVQALAQFAGHLATDDDLARRDYELAIRLANWAGELCQWNDPEVVHTLAVVYNNFAVSLGAKGDFARAVEYYAKSIETDPDYAAPLFNLALLRSTSVDAAIRRPDEAVRLAEQACRLSASPSANELMILGMAYAQIGKADEAIATVERAIVAAEDSGDSAFADSLRARLQLFRDQGSTVAPPQP
jgi:tetratricopeptide (TPR) repeat protein